MKVKINHDHESRLDLRACLSDLPPGFINITDPALEIKETAFKFAKGIKQTDNHFYLACPFERCVYKACWEGGGSITTRITNKIFK